MLLIVGYVIVLAASLGTYAVHGSLAALWVPTEYIAIVGLMIGGFIASNGTKAIKSTMATLPSVLKGSSYNKAYYMDVLALMYELLSKVRKEGLMSIEGDIENADASPIFSKYPAFMSDHHAVEFLTDYLRMMVGGNLNAFEIENLMDMEIETHHQEAHGPAHVMSKVADSVPAFGIVVAVMGVVNVMGSVGQPPAVLGKMIGGALVGTFLGILVSYGFVAPIAGQLEQKVEEGSKIYQCMKVVLLASMNGYAPQVAIEFGRKVLFSSDRPSFIELEEDVKSRKG
ncbi:flagellar motor stator protein MotA [Denitromonas ohlonensis]|uniref:Flagellar motor stator protein MotA n=2 Tax=Denitromonas TaxID=139331 RepID=A0A557SIB0_9RHOO|nr:flagellar motor stator protein MotA [Denitromonas ohlonensis]TVT49124.1 MAG: flagellar motor stator protein MotA [Denitromonas halophila]TVO69065.1 flagellar motor stator protein MotA [Denitromonas ohlonensis]TVO77165.1 flagellar motor stator protein MotA [Denitromonas ohlonensis]TVT73320.1 MAG: flagellar motor stator protein MotA [Denitromonas halophila]TVT78211.1 MAG: flagellar motor stator protein MotA [Denitromonas halophila]